MIVADDDTCTCMCMLLPCDISVSYDSSEQSNTIIETVTFAISAAIGTLHHQQ
jgi:hypothetical protein